MCFLVPFSNCLRAQKPQESLWNTLSSLQDLCDSSNRYRLFLVGQGNNRGEIKGYIWADTHRVVGYEDYILRDIFPRDDHVFTRRYGGGEGRREQRDIVMSKKENTNKEEGLNGYG